MMSVLFRCFIHMEGYIAHIQPWSVSFKEYYIHPRVLLHSNAFLCITAWISIKWRLFTYLHQHFLWGIPWSLSKMSTQRIPFSRNTTPSIFQKCVTLLNEILQKVMLHFYTSTLLSEYRELHPFKYCCIYWGILCKINVAFSWRNAPPFLRDDSLFTMEHCKQVMLHYNSFLNILYTVIKEYCID